MEFYEYCERNEIIADNVIINEVSSKFWIDNRFDIKSETFLHNYEIKREEKEINKRLISEDTVKPSEIKHDGIVEIVEKENKICLYYEKNPYFIMFQPENPWSLDRGMNGVMFKLLIFYRNTIKLVKYMI